MAAALQTVHAIADAQATVDVRLAMTVFVRGGLDAWIDALWHHSSGCLSGKPLTMYRAGADFEWRSLRDAQGHADAQLTSVHSRLRQSGVLEFRGGVGDDLDALGVGLELADLPEVSGLQRASHFRLLFDDNAPAGEIGAWVNWTLDHVPLWWLSAGYVFHHRNGYRDVAYQRIAAIAKRYWCVQVQDLSSLQWDAIQGMPSVNWANAVGREFAIQQGTSVDEIAAHAATVMRGGIFHRLGTHGIAVASGPRPLLGDINADEDFSAYSDVATLLKPLLLTEHTPLSGPFEKPDLMSAWLRRFENPYAWLDCPISAD
jgi:hypothetical protein